MGQEPAEEIHCACAAPKKPHTQKSRSFGNELPFKSCTCRAQSKLRLCRSALYVYDLHENLACWASHFKVVKEKPYLESVAKLEWKILSGAEFHIPYLRSEGKFRGLLHSNCNSKQADSMNV